MGIFNFNLTKSVEQIPTIIQNVGKGIKSFNFNGGAYTNQESIERSGMYKSKNSINGLPVIDVFNTTAEWVKFDSGDNFPLYLLDMYIASPINNAIINNKSSMIAGSDLIIKDYADNEYEKVSNLSITNNLMETIKKASFDLELYGAFALELFYNGSILVKMENVSPQYIRAKRPKNIDDAITHWYYSKDFLDVRVPNYLYESYVPYRKSEETSVIFYYKSNTSQIDIYGIPDWLSAQKSVLIDGKISDFHNSNLDNSFSPSTHIHFFTSMNQTDDEIVDFARKLNASFAGSKKAGKPFITSSDNADNAIQVRQLEASNLDKRFEQLQTSIVNQILIGHSITSPELVGVAIPGKLGTASLVDSYTIFEKTVIGPKRKTLEEQFNKLFKENGVKLQIELTEFNVLK